MVITGDVFLFFLGLLALVLMGMSNRNILLAFSSSMVWFTLFLWLFFSDTPPLDLSKDWVQILSYVFMVLAVIPWLLRMDTEIRSEKGTQRWTEWGKQPSTKESGYERYKKELRKRTRR